MSTIISKLISKTSAALALSLVLPGCLSSPLLAHREAEASFSRQNAPQDLSSCPLEFAKTGYCASLSWEQFPGEETEGKFLLRFWNAAEASEAGPYGEPPFSLKVKLWMPAMGHGSSPVKLAPLKDASGAPIAGIFEVSQVFFTMPGAWEIWVHAEKGGALIEKAKIDFTY